MANAGHSVDVVMKRIREVAAQAVCRYANVSGDSRNAMPEYFMPAYVFDKLGSTFTMTLETNSRTLRRWDEDAKRRRARLTGSESLEPEKSELEEAIRRLDHGGRIDLIVFDGKSHRKDCEGFLVMVEFKKWDRDKAQADRDKLLAVMSHVHTCPYGAICYLINSAPDSEWAGELKEEARRHGDKWCCEPVLDELKEGRGTFAICSELFSRDAQPYSRGQQ